MGLFGRKKKNPFGLPETYNTPGIGDGLPQGGSMDAAPANPSWLEGGKFTGRDAIGMALAAIGDVAALQNGGQASSSAMILGQMQQNRRMQQEKAEEARLATAMRARGMDDNQIALVLGGAAKMGDFTPDKPKEQRQSDGAGNEWVKGPDGAWKIDFVNPVNKMDMMGHVITNPFAGRNPRDIPPIGATVDAAGIFGGPTIQNTPAPALGSDGFPSELTQQQYQALVAQKGQAAVDDLIRRRGIRIGGR